MTQIQECRSCESEHPPEELSPTGLCTNCIPRRGPAPTTTSTPAGPGRQAIQSALAGFRQGKNQENHQ